MVQYDCDGVDFRNDEFETVTVLAVHGSRGLAFVKTLEGRIRTARTCGRTYHRFTKVDMFKNTGVLF